MTNAWANNKETETAYRAASTTSFESCCCCCWWCCCCFWCVQVAARGDATACPYAPALLLFSLNYCRTFSSLYSGCCCCCCCWTFNTRRKMDLNGKLSEQIPFLYTKFHQCISLDVVTSKTSSSRLPRGRVLRSQNLLLLLSAVRASHTAAANRLRGVIIGNRVFFIMGCT